LHVALAAPGEASGVGVERHRTGATTFKFGESTETSRTPPGDPTEGVPDAVRALAGDVAELLKGVSVTVLGDNTELNASIARVLAPLLEYTPLVTREVVEQFTQQPLEETVEEEGWGALGAVEAVVMEQLSVNVRTVIATLGGGGGAAARGDCWRHLFSHMCVWVEEVPEAGTTEVVEDKPQNEAYAQAEVQVKVLEGRDQAELALDTQEQILGALKVLLQREDDSPGLDLAGKKLLYIKLGVRGDWPDIRPPEWQPEA